MEIIETDFKFLRKLASLYEALTYSAIDPVVIKNITEIGENKIEMGMFYDAFGEASFEDLETANSIMMKRIERASNDIKKHDDYHKEFLRLFYDIDEFVNRNDRNKVAEASRNLCQRVKYYVCKIVEPHISRLQENNFLYPPSCIRDYAFYIPNAKLVGSLVFNRQQTIYGAEVYLNKIIMLSQNFSEIKEKIPIDKIATQCDLSEGIMDTSLRGRYELNKELLRRIGFDLDLV